MDITNTRKPLVDRLVIRSLQKLLGEINLTKEQHKVFRRIIVYLEQTSNRSLPVRLLTKWLVLPGYAVYTTGGDGASMAHPQLIKEGLSEEELEQVERQLQRKNEQYIVVNTTPRRR